MTKYQYSLKEQEIKQSMSRKGNCLNNAVMQEDDAVNSLAWSPNGQSLASAANGKVKLWDPLTSKVLREINTFVNLIYSIAWSPDRTMLAIGGTGDEIELHNSITGQRLAALSHPHTVTSVAWSSNGLLASSSLHKDVKVWNFEKNTDSTIEAGSPVESVAWSSDGKRLAAGLWYDAIIWDLGSTGLVSG